MRSGTRRAAAPLLAVVAIITWVAYGLLHALPEVDDQGRHLLYLGYGHSRMWWSLVAYSVAATASYALLVWLLRRLVQGTRSHRRGVASVAAVFLALASGVALSVIGGGTLFLVAGEGKQTLVPGADGTEVLVTEDAFDGDIVLFWRKVGPFVYVRE